MAAPRSGRAFIPFVCQSCRQSLLPRCRRAFTTTTRSRADDSPSDDSPLRGLSQLSNQMSQNRARTRRTNTNPNPAAFSYTSALDQSPAEAQSSLLSSAYGENLNALSEEKAHRLHVYAHKHNTHITLVQPPKSAAHTASSHVAGTRTSATEQKKIVDTLLSISTGNIGFRKAGRGSYDAAFQLAAFALRQISEKGMMRDMKKLEVVLRGFGAGREAVTKALLGTEGRVIRKQITSVVDATRLKQGGPRSKKPRRLG